ncbi:MAG: sigma-70 family RNA polymerase sigma factor [Oscillospiraceae bacterium]|nr:sigma-70 family RNA polymerase sigma factor [Oscillospiraceae bacterium]
MARRVSEKCLEFDKHFVADLIEAPVTNRSQLNIVHEALRDSIENDLTPRQREILLMRYFEGKKGVEIAEDLHINSSTVTRTLQRAENTLRRSLRFYMRYLNCRFHEE